MTTKQRKVVVATYTQEECFKVPEHIDLDNKEQVEEYWVKYNTLYIKLVGVEDPLEIDGVGGTDNEEYKYPDTMKICDADDTWVNWTDSEDEEEDDKEDEEDEDE